MKLSLFLSIAIVLGVYGKNRLLTNNSRLDVENASELDKFEARFGAVEIGWNFVVKRVGDKVRVYLEALADLEDSKVSAEFTLIDRDGDPIFTLSVREDMHDGGFIIGSSTMMTWEEFESCIDFDDNVARFDIKITRVIDCTLCGHNH